MKQNKRERKVHGLPSANMRRSRRPSPPTEKISPLASRHCRRPQMPTAPPLTRKDLATGRSTAATEKSSPATDHGCSLLLALAQVLKSQVTRTPHAAYDGEPVYKEQGWRRERGRDALWTRSRLEDGRPRSILPRIADVAYVFSHETKRATNDTIL
jgi:hypothetical protein